MPSECLIIPGGYTSTPIIFYVYRYFSHSSSLSISSWTTEDQDALERCGHCDNCKRAADATENKDVSFQAWQLLKIVEHLHNNKANITLNLLVGLAKNASNGAFEVGQGRVRRKERIDLEEVAGGVVDLSKAVRDSFTSCITMGIDKS